MYSLAEENYLKALYLIAGASGAVNVNDLSKHLNIKMPTVNSMMKKLYEKKLVEYESYKPIRLTKEGQKQAALIIRKHRLTEMFLVEKMGFGWEEVHEIAEQIEHLHSPLFFDKMDAMLGFPKADPHGSPIPNKSGEMEWVDYVNLCDCKEGEKVILSAVTRSSDEFLKFLNTKQIKLGDPIVVHHIEPYDGSMQLLIGKNPLETYSKVVCEKLLVRR
ncbi:iron (metal) dependent repressor, dtxr family protein [Taibaiella sp. KBW10]|uniref:metal-dependent transcriptional regulator n=1 Tax=Taibaiella sp. KBW10 TaxID=2153357 RepID=UPI000F591DF4|nr:metal-dependent transcriptional regulator [Taibaiella sp. KBW10]RQO32420.1 iron (metal) dependent repressor, dtxr family protein [Taibaiella sp. KBW10]